MTIPTISVVNKMSPTQSMTGSIYDRKNYSNKDIFEILMAQNVKLAAQNEQLVAQNEQLVILSHNIKILEEGQNSTANKIKELNELLLQAKVQNSTSNQIEERSLVLYTSDAPFTKRVELAIQKNQKRQESLENDLDETLDILYRLDDHCEELKIIASTLKYEEYQCIDDKKVFIYPKETFQNTLKSYEGSLNFAVKMPMQLQERITEELTALNSSEGTLPPPEKEYRNRLTKKINQAHLTSNKLSNEMKSLLDPSIVILPELRNLEIEISKLFDELEKQKHLYQAMTMTTNDWGKLNAYLESQQKKFQALSKKAEEYEKITKKLYADITLIPAENKSKDLFFAHSNIIQVENDNNWKSMIETVNIEIERLKSSILTQWNVICKNFTEAGLQIDHLGYAGKEKAFPIKLAISASYALWSTRQAGTYAPVTITPIT